MTQKIGLGVVIISMSIILHKILLLIFIHFLQKQEIFKKHKLLYSPGKASNAGGVATSGLEMSQNSMRQKWTAEEVDNYLRRIMSDIHANCLKYGTDPDGYIDYVRGANVAGFMKVATAMMDQGLV